MSPSIEERNALVVYQELEKPDFLKQLTRAIPNTLKPERMIRLVYSTLRKNPKLAECDIRSLMAGVVECASLGLELGTVLGLADLVPFGKEAVLIIGYKGFAQLMYQSGQVTGVSAEIHREGDIFKRVLGTERRLIHVPKEIPLVETKKGSGIFEADDPQSRWIGAYAAVRMVNGNQEFEYMEKALIYSHRARSRSWQKHLKDGKESPWAKYPDAISMWCKTPIRKLAKRMPISTTDQRLQRAATIDEYGDRKGLLIPTLGGYELNDNPPDEDEKAGADVQPTREVIDVSSDSAPSNEAPKQEAPKGKRGKKQAPPTRQSTVPKAQIPPAEPVKKEAPKSPAPEPPIVPAQQTELYNAALSSGWKLDEFRNFIVKKFGVDRLGALPQSQFKQAMKFAKEGE